MTRPRRALMAVLTAVVAVLAAPLPGTAHAQHAAELRLDLTSYGPRMVTAGGPDKMTVTGRLTNIGGRRVDNVQVRLQRGDRIPTADRLDDALSGTATNMGFIQPASQQVATSLDPGRSVTFRLEAPLLGSTPDSLRITEPSVYPVQVEVTGRPGYGPQGRVAEAHMLLPVLGLPGDGARAAPSGSAPQLSLVWPVVDKPRAVSTTPDGRPVLADEELVNSLGPNGRLHNILRAVEQETSADSPVGNALCFAIDPDLVHTVTAMAEKGYQVRTGNGVAEGTSANTARAWLDRLKEVTKGRCVFALPFADPDLVALSRAGLADQVGEAMKGADQVHTALGTQLLQNVVWPAGGLLDERALSDLVVNGTQTVLVEPRGLRDEPPGLAPVRVSAGRPSGGSMPLALQLDPLFTQALAAGAPPATAVQDAIGVLAHRTAVARPQGPLLLAPPRRWDYSLDDMRALLRAVREVADAKLAELTSLQQLTALQPDGRTAGLNYPVDAGNQEVPAAVTARVTGVRNQVRDLRAAASADPATNYEPGTLLGPISYGLLRSTSTAWRGSPELAQRWAASTDGQLTDIRHSIKVVKANSYTLASSDSPLPLTITNELPVNVDVRIHIADTAGVRTQEIEVQRVPARGSVQRRIPAQVERSGRFFVDVRLATPGGTALGEPVRLTLESTAYGSITTGITIGAAVLLLALSARRVIRRVRTARAGKNGNHGAPTAHAGDGQE
ncbi:glycoprotein [Longimycelium tulufanense]|uniref:Glycoprotein n=1 Tax=Longimycelium tulufanense TaxID=907463 RepID=A0A8J3CAU1_9PSEU|nr:DUF6049 family protein [Longimycelium tulufanense]GGM66777.1 glycoprotein [Longimycelium tulufanense]